MALVSISKTLTMAFYRRPLAQIHHHDYTETALAAAKVVNKLLYNSFSFSAHIVDLGCGSGVLLKEIAAHGHQTTGIDASADLLTIAQREVPNANLIHGSIYQVELPKAELFIATGEVLNYNFDQQHHLNRLEDLFLQIYRALPSEGFLIFDLIESGVLNGQKRQCKIVDNDLWTMFIELIENDEGTTLTRKMTYFIKERQEDFYQKDSEQHNVLLFDRDTIKKVLFQAGFPKVNILEGYGEFQLRNHHYVVIAQK